MGYSMRPRQKLTLGAWCGALRVLAPAVPHRAWPVALSRRSLALARHKGTHLLGRLSKGHVVFLLRDKSRSQWRNYMQSANNPGQCLKGSGLEGDGRAADSRHW